MEEAFICSCCGDEITDDNYFMVGEEIVCEICALDETVLCSRCGERIWECNNAGDDDTPLCSRCYDQYYTTCDSCGRVLNLDDSYRIDEDDDEVLCYNCYLNSSKERSIESYYYKPQPTFYGDDPLYFGVELEIDGAGESSSNAREILAAANAENEHIYCKHDGSLDAGFEIVTHPMTLDYHLNQMPWQNVLSKAISQGYQSHQAKTCGLHIHVNRTAFGSTESEQDSAIANVLYLVEKHWEELLKFSRRTQRQLERWAARYGYKEHPHEILENAKKGYGGGRYTCINLQNFSTIEFRIFRGTLKYNTLIATLQMVYYLCDLAIYLSTEEIKKLPWTSLVSGIHKEKYPELIQYLKERRLYINEITNVEEEI